MTLREILAALGLGLVIGLAFLAYALAPRGETDPRLQEALATYAAAGLEIENVTVEWHESADCPIDTLGRYVRAERKIVMCSDSQQILLHELGHVWEADNVTDDQRADLMAANPYLEEWASHEASHSRRGVELAAEAIVWGIDSRPIGCAGSGWNANYKILTGADSQRIECSL